MVGLDERPGFYVAFLALVEHPEGGRRQDAKRPKKRGARGLCLRPRAFCLAGRGAALGAAPRPPNAAAPREAAPPFPFPRATAVGPAEVRWGTGSGLPLGYAGGGGVLRARRARKTKAGAGAKGPRPCFVRAVRARRPPGAMGFSTGQTIHPPTLSAPASNKET